MGSEMLKKSILLLILLNCLTGCTLLLLGGGAAGGYYVGTDERSLGEITDDAAITSKVKTKYFRDDHIHALDINVSTRNKVVTLEGTVKNKMAGERAIQIAKNTRGVLAIVNKLEVMPK